MRRDLLEADLTQLKSHPDIAPIPVLVVTGKRKAAAQLRASAPGWVVDILLKPVSSAQLRQAVEAVLARHQEGGTEETLEKIQEQQFQLIQRLIVEGSDSLVLQTCPRRAGLRAWATR
jgi:response regulator RpfG family c-di-GMP phosphodiesterase